MARKPDRKPPEIGAWRQSLGDAGPYLGLGMQLALTVVLFTGLGFLVDRWLGTLPWATIAGAMLGIVMLFVQVVRVSVDLARKGEERRRTDQVDQSGESGR